MRKPAALFCGNRIISHLTENVKTLFLILLRFVQHVKIFADILSNIPQKEVDRMEYAFFDQFVALCKSKGVSPNFVAREIGASSGSVTAWKQGVIPRSATLTKIADYFEVSTDYLLGNTKNPDQDSTYPISDDEIKFALFGGKGEITDEMYEEVKRFAAYVKQREADKK